MTATITAPARTFWTVRNEDSTRDRPLSVSRLVVGVWIRVAAHHGVTRLDSWYFEGESKGTLDGRMSLSNDFSIASVLARETEVRSSRHFSVEGRLEITSVLSPKVTSHSKISTLSAHHMAPPS